MVEIKNPTTKKKIDRSSMNQTERSKKTDRSPMKKKTD